METAVLHYRYPGSRPFQDTDLDRRLFFGREHETQLLLHTVLAERLTVLFAKSGMGKTSLLNAGIMQLLRERNFLPFVVRFNFPEMNPLEAVYEGIKTAVQQAEGEYDANKTLLDYFSNVQFSSFDLWTSEEIKLTPVLILDQFEEFFALHAPEKRNDFIVQLAELVRKRIPEIKIIISIREDYSGQLEEIAKELPDIFQNRFRISALTREQARKAIEEPARVEAQEFQTTSFHYAPETIDSMLDFLYKQRKRDEVSISDEVEPFQLQLLCQHVESTILEKVDRKEGEIVIQKTDLGGEAGMQQILQEFYTNQLNKFRSSPSLNPLLPSNHGGTRMPQKKCMIITLGTGKGVEYGIAKSITFNAPDRIIFIATKEGLEQEMPDKIGQVMSDYFKHALPEHRTEIVDDPQNVEMVYQAT